MSDDTTQVKGPLAEGPARIRTWLDLENMHEYVVRLSAEGRKQLIDEFMDRLRQQVKLDEEAMATLRRIAVGLQRALELGSPTEWRVAMNLSIDMANNMLIASRPKLGG